MDTALLLRAVLTVYCAHIAECWCWL